MERPGRFWHNLSISKKLYVVVGIMGVLIATELLTLSFAMHTLSAVRAFVEGEGSWSKSQKDAVLALKDYSVSSDERYYQDFLNHLQVPLGDRKARVNMLSPKPNIEAITEGFLQGKIHKDDIPRLVELVNRFQTVSYISRALKIWTEADRVISSLIETANDLHLKISNKAPKSEILASIRQIEYINRDLTVLEDGFSNTLAEGSRWMEKVLLGLLLLAVLTIETTSVIVTLSLSRNLSKGLAELCEVAHKVGQGNFGAKASLRAQDELGDLANAINGMSENLKNSVGEKNKAQSASRLKSLFLANVSHEIRTPLGAILGFSQLLKDPQLGASERDHYIDIIYRMGSNLTKIINDLLDLSKVEAGKIEIESKVFSLEDLLSDLRQVLSIRAWEKSLTFKFLAEGTIPKQIRTDCSRLHQILMNVLGNAVKFTDQGFVRLRYGVKDSKELVFLIEDSGIGLSPREQGSIFQDFGRAEHKLRRREGTGLGLVLSQKLARLMGGDLSLKKSRPGHGSTFQLRIRFEDVSVLAPHPEQKSILWAEFSPKIINKNVLVVEDVEENRFLIKKLLEKKGMSVTLATNGEEGYKKALAGNFDLVLMDVQMPVLDGFSATQILRRYGYQKPIIALTAHAMKDDREQCIQAGYSDYLTKPIEIARFYETLEKYA